jgi:hypothetical protein
MLNSNACSLEEHLTDEIPCTLSRWYVVKHGRLACESRLMIAKPHYLQPGSHGLGETYAIVCRPVNAGLRQSLRVNILSMVR